MIIQAVYKETKTGWALDFISLEKSEANKRADYLMSDDHDDSVLDVDVRELCALV